MNDTVSTSGARHQDQCIFCRIIRGELPSTPVYQDDDLFVIPDIHPKAPVHLLILPKRHEPMSVADMQESDQALMGKMLWRAKVLAEEQGIAGQGYRLIFNVRHHGGQEVDHLHLHLLGGLPLDQV